jgi:hypothetical protein
MLKSVMHDMALAVQTRTGITAPLVLWLAVLTLATSAAFVFICVAGYDWLSLQLGGAVAALIMAGIFIVLALAALLVCASSRRRARERAILERAARAHTPSWLLDPRILATAVQIGRSLGWQRVLPLALVGLMAAQWAREHREQVDERPD